MLLLNILSSVGTPPASSASLKRGLLQLTQCWCQTNLFNRSMHPHTQRQAACMHAWALQLPAQLLLPLWCRGVKLQLLCAVPALAKACHGLFLGRDELLLLHLQCQDGTRHLQRTEGGKLLLGAGVVRRRKHAWRVSQHATILITS
jgi:hypothetical protein